MTNPARLPAAIAWLGCAAAASVLVLRSGRPWPLVLAGAALSLAVPEREEPGWLAFVAASLARIADTAVIGALAWRLGWLDGDVAGAGAAVTLLSAALVSAYVRIRATSLGIDGRPWSSAGTRPERGVRLAMVGAGLAGPLVPMLWAASALTLALAAVRSAGVWRSASHG